MTRNVRYKEEMHDRINRFVNTYRDEESLIKPVRYDRIVKCERRDCPMRKR